MLGADKVQGILIVSQKEYDPAVLHAKRQPGLAVMSFFLTVWSMVTVGC